MLDLVDQLYTISQGTRFRGDIPRMTELKLFEFLVPNPDQVKMSRHGVTFFSGIMIFSIRFSRTILSNG